MSLHAGHDLFLVRDDADLVGVGHNVDKYAKQRRMRLVVPLGLGLGLGRSRHLHSCIQDLCCLWSIRCCGGLRAVIRAIVRCV